MRLGICIATLALVPIASACSQGQGGGPGIYSATQEGVNLRIEVPYSDLSDRISGIEDFREALGLTGGVTYLLQRGTNESESTQVMCDPKVVTEQGETVSFDKAFIYVGDLQDQVSIESVDLYNQGVDLYNSLLDESKLLPGATTTILYVADQTVPSIKSVFGGVTEEQLQVKGCETQFAKIESFETQSSAMNEVLSTPSGAEAKVVIDALSALPAVSAMEPITGSFWQPTTVEETSSSLPLQEESRQLLNFGKIATIEPKECAVYALAVGGGLPVELANDVSLVSTADIADKAYLDEGLSAATSIHYWGVEAYQLEGAAVDEAARQLATPIAECREATSKARSGLAVPDGEISSLVDRATQTSKSVLISADSADLQVLSVELIGDVLFRHVIVAGRSISDDVLALHNSTMDKVALEAGTSREPLVLPGE